jgi:hypothetical protein
MCATRWLRLCHDPELREEATEVVGAIARKAAETCWRKEA